MKPVNVDIPAGTHIEAAAILLVGRANLAGASAVGRFNGVTLRAEPGSSAPDIAAEYDRKQAEASARWRRSAKGRAAAKASAEEVAALQSQANALAVAVGNLDLSDQPAVLTFLGDQQKCSDRVGVRVDAQEILVAFAFGGLTPNMCVGDAFNADDRDIFFRWLVGQALDGLANGPAIHGMFHKFCDDWRARWGSPA